jgi:hypothetical protein
MTARDPYKKLRGLADAYWRLGARAHAIIERTGHPDPKAERALIRAMQAQDAESRRLAAIGYPGELIADALRPAHARRRS